MMRTRILGAIVAAFVVIADQLVKWILLEGVQIHQRPPIELLPFFNLVMVWNEGISFGMFSGHGGRGALYLAAMAGAITLLLLVWLWRSAEPFVGLALGLVIGGSVGNIIDRLRFGAVADFFDFHVGGWHYPAFNIADSAIFIGVCLLLWDGFMREPKRKKAADSA